jgi:hypothetical protein
MSSRAAQTARDHLDFNCEILHFVQDDRVIGGVMHDVALKWNKKK